MTALRIEALVSAWVAFVISCSPRAREMRSVDARVVSEPDIGFAPPVCAEPGTVLDQYPCHCATDCRDGAFCAPESDSNLPRGRCVRQCSPSGPPTCAEGYVCAPANGSTTMGQCRVACSGGSDVCPPNAACDALIHSCFEYCASDEDCESHQCNPYSGRCIEDGSSISGAGIYEPCTRHSDCRSALCSPVSHRCLSGCAVSRQSCPDGALCVTSQDNNDWGLCYVPCDDPSVECPAGESCLGTTHPDGHRVCAVR